MTQKSDKKWKDSLLKTGLPLEYLVAEKLSELKYGIQGEYRYLRPNEQGIPTEFSIDLWERKGVKSAFDPWQIWGHHTSFVNPSLVCRLSGGSIFWITCFPTVQ
jgi:hypothetical protein